MERRYEAYKTHVVRPFFRDHFARLDRQIVLIDVLAALNGGAEAVSDLERAMTEILECFRTGANTLWSSLFAPRIDRIVLAATKADHLHHQSHDRLEAILAKLTGTGHGAGGICRRRDEGAGACRGARDTRGRSAGGTARRYPASSVIRWPARRSASGPSTATRSSPSSPEICPRTPSSRSRAGRPSVAICASCAFARRTRFPLPSGGFAPFPNIRLDRALQALIGDRLA